MINNYNVKDNTAFAKIMFAVVVLNSFCVIFFTNPSLGTVANISASLIVWAIVLELQKYSGKHMKMANLAIDKRQELIEKFERERVAKHNLKIRQARRIRVELFGNKKNDKPK